MAATKASVGQGAQFYTGVGTTSITYTAVLEQVSIKPPGRQLGAVDATNLTSPSNAMENIPAGVFGYSELEFSGNYLGDSTQVNLVTLLEAQTVFPFKFTSGANIKDGAKTLTVTGTGFLVDVSVGSFAVGQKNTISAKLKVTGPLVETIA